MSLASGPRSNAFDGAQAREGGSHVNALVMEFAEGKK